MNPQTGDLLRTILGGDGTGRGVRTAGAQTPPLRDLRTRGDAGARTDEASMTRLSTTSMNGATMESTHCSALDRFAGAGRHLGHLLAMRQVGTAAAHKRPRRKPG